MSVLQSAMGNPSFLWQGVLVRCLPAAITDTNSVISGGFQDNVQVRLLVKLADWRLADSTLVTVDASPTDGLWDDGRTDEDQIGTSYKMLEWVMEDGLNQDPMFLNGEQITAINAYQKFNSQNKHKMLSIPTFKL